MKRKRSWRILNDSPLVPTHPKIKTINRDDDTALETIVPLTLPYKEVVHPYMATREHFPKKLMLLVKKFSKHVPLPYMVRATPYMAM